MSDAATFCATLVDEWCRTGVRHAVVSPGSRSTPMVLALADRADAGDLTLHVVHDERSAAFTALGIGLMGAPAIVLCTSGTAAANLLPAVVEAGLSAVPMLVVTADRPPELRDVAAAQTIDQTHLFGRSVRWFHDPGVPDGAVAGTWRSLARRARAAAAEGPVHLNLPFREPLLGDPAGLPGPLLEPAAEPPAPAAWSGSARSDGSPDDVVESVLGVQRGIIVAGGRSGVWAESISRFAERTGWPVLADPTSSARSLPGSVTAFDPIVRHRGFADAHAPEVVVRLGRPPASRALAEWLARVGAPVVQVGGPHVIDPDHRVVATCRPEQLDRIEVAGAAGTPWAARWRHADQAAQRAIDEVLDPLDVLTEPGVARAVSRWQPDDVRLVVASSMPIRDVEWFGGPGVAVHANRGANGIDGTTSTALGLALSAGPTVALVGDVAFVHDAGALIGLAARQADLRVVVVDNDGGGIFSFLPQAASLRAARFEQLYGTPHGTDVVAFANAHGVRAETVIRPTDMLAALNQPGPSVVRVPTDRTANVAIHRQLEAAVADALDRRP